MFKQISLITVATLISVSASAKILSCNVREINSGKSYDSVVNVNIDENSSHGSIANVTFEHHENITGMIAFMKGYAVLSISHNTSGMHTSSIGDVSAGNIAKHQLIMPSTVPTKTNAIEVECSLM